MQRKMTTSGNGKGLSESLHLWKKNKDKLQALVFFHGTPNFVRHCTKSYGLTSFEHIVAQKLTGYMHSSYNARPVLSYELTKRLIVM